MKIAGICLMLIGLASGVYALVVFDVSIPSANSPAYAIIPDRVVNLQLIALQLAMMLGAVAAFMGGTVLFSAGWVVDKISLRRLASQVDPS